MGAWWDAADTPGALSRLMDGLQECKPKRLILVLGCPGEAQEEMRPFMGEIAHYKVRPPPANPSGALFAADLLRLLRFGC